VTEEQAAFLSKAEDSIAAARLLAGQDFNDIAASRAYYAMFYSATAMLLAKNLRFKTHNALANGFGQEIVQADLLPVELHGWLLDAANARNASDYRADRRISPEEAEAHIGRAEIFLARGRVALRQALENSR